jgi:ABC-2 type transport system ATP-binding protein
MSNENTNFKPSAPLVITNLSKYYPVKKSKSIKALDNISLTVEPGDFVGLLGLNGSGKSTLLNIITSILRPTSGSVKVFGHDIAHQRSLATSHIGFMAQEPNLDDFQNIYDLILLHMGLYGIDRHHAIPRALEMIDLFSLSDKKYATRGKLSGGMVRRVMLIKALITNPKILILDEPTSGVDLELSDRIWEYIKDRNKEGMTVILTTHVIDSLMAMCNSLIFLKSGTISNQGPLEKFKKQINSKDYVLTTSALPNTLPLEFRHEIINPHSLKVNFPTDGDLHNLLSQLKELDITVSNIDTIDSMEGIIRQGL